MSLFKNINTTTDVQEIKDTLGGNKFIVPTDVYKVKVDSPYIHVANSGAMAVKLTLVTEDNSKIKLTEYICSGTAKGSKTYYERDGKQFFLPGFNLMNSLAMMTLNKSIIDLDSQSKIINTYSFVERKEMPTKVDLLGDLHGVEVYAAIKLTIVDKESKNAEGIYVPNGDTRETNEVNQFFHYPTKLSVYEAKNKLDAEFMDKWIEANKDKIFNKTSKKVNTSNKAKIIGNATKVTSLFGK